MMATWRISSRLTKRSVWIIVSKTCISFIYNSLKAIRKPDGFSRPANIMNDFLPISILYILSHLRDYVKLSMTPIHKCTALSIASSSWHDVSRLLRCVSERKLERTALSTTWSIAVTSRLKRVTTNNNSSVGFVVWVHSKPNIAGRCDIQWNALLDEIFYQPRILDSPHAMCNALSSKCVQRAPNTLRSRHFTGVRHAVQPVGTRLLKPPGKSFWRCALL